MAIEKFIESIPVGPLAIVALSGSKALGETVDAYISDWRSERVEAKESPITFKGYVKDSYLLDVSTPRFGTGEAKCTLKDTVRGCDLYIIDDVTNYSIEYTVCGQKNHMSPDDHYADIKRVIAAAAGKAKKITVIMPFLYEADSTDVLPENLWIVQLCYRNLLIWELIIFLLSMPMTHELTMLFLFTVLSQLCQHISSLKIF